MRTCIRFLTVSLCICAIAAVISANTEWTNMVSPINHSVWPDIAITDFDTDGIPDFVAANPNEGEQYSDYSGLPVWIGKEYKPGANYFWALASWGDLDGDTVSMPEPDPNNIGGGVIQLISNGNLCNHMCDWEIEVIAEAGISSVINISGDYTAEKDEGSVWSDIFHVYSEDPRYFSFTQIGDTNFFNSEYHGHGGGFGPVMELGVPYTYTDNQVSFTCYDNSPGNSSGNRINGEFRVYLKPAGVKVSTEYRDGTDVISWAGGNDYLPVGKTIWDEGGKLKITIEPSADGNSFRTGDKWYFHTPNGPPTTSKYVAVETADINHDGQQDIIAAGPQGIDIFLQSGPKISNVSFIDNESRFTGTPTMPVWLGHYNPDTQTSYINNSSICDETWIVKWNERDDIWEISGINGGQSDPLQYGAVERVVTCCGEATIGIPTGGYYDRDDQFSFSIKRVNWHPRSGPSSSNSYTDLAVGDVDRNGWEDILASKITGGFDVFLYDGVEWTYSSGIPFNGVVTDMQMEDINRDGWLDVVASSDIGVHYWKGLTTGGWSQDLGPAQNRSFNGVVAADLNRDGIADIAATENLSGNTGAIQVWYLRADGTWFQNSKATVPTKGANNVGDGFMGFVRVSDTKTIAEKWVITCEQTQPNGGLFKVVGSRSGQQSTYATVGQAFISDQDEVSFSLFDGDIDYAVGDYFTFKTGKGPIELRQFGELSSGDLDNDGNLDLFASSLENFGVGIWFGNSNYGWIADTPPESSSSWQCINSSRDINFDGNPDIVLGSYADSGELGGGIKVWTGQHSNENTWTGWIPGKSINGKFNKISNGDFNTDGALDIVLACDDNTQEGIWVLTGNNLGVFTKVTETVTSKSDYFSVITGDFNNDGVSDIAAGHKTDGFDVFLTQPGMTWAPSSSSVNTGEILDMYANDLDCDGDLDIIIAQNFFSALRTGIIVYWNNGQGYFSDGESERTLIERAVYNYWSVSVADFDNDGIGDIIAANTQANPGVQVYYGNFVDGEWVTGEPYAVFAATGLYHTYGLFSNDFNLDGKTDFVFGTDGQGGYLKRGFSGLSGCCRFSGSLGVGWGKIRDMDSQDLNNDGYPDLVMVSEQNGVQAYLTSPAFPGEPGFNFQAISHPATDHDYVGVTVADFTSDGLPDIIASRNQDSGVSTLDMWISNRDFTMAKVSGTSPGSGGYYEVQRDTAVYVYFSEPMDPATMTYDNVQLTLNDAPVAYSFVTIGDNTALRINPTSTIRQEIYKVTIVGGPNGVRDNNGNMFDGNYNNIAEASPIDDYTFTFTAIDTIPPSIPTGLDATPGDAQVTLQWLANGDPTLDQDIVGYYVIWKLADDPKPQWFYKLYSVDELGSPPTVTIRGMTNGREINCSLTAIDETGNESAESGLISVIPQATNPQIWWGGMYDTFLTSAQGGEMTLLAYVYDPQNDAQSVELYYDDLPTGAMLVDGGHPDFPPGLGLFALHAPVDPLNTGFIELPFQLVAHDAAGNDSLMWPYYHMMSDHPGSTQNSKSTPRPGTWESYFKNKEFEFLRNTRLPFEKETQRPSTSPNRPQILCAGYGAHAYGDFEWGALHWMTVIVLDPDNPPGGHDLTSVKLFYNGLEFGTFVDSGIASEGYIDQIELSPVLWGMNMTWFGQENDPDGPDGENHWDEGPLFLEVQAYDRQGNASDVWPNFTIN